jgi:hypothetical protein
MWLSDLYEVPQELIDNPPSPEFRQFLLNWFGSSAVDRGEKVRSATCLVPEELALARELMRRNLKTNYGRIINGTWILGDTEAIPLLREMFGNEPDEGRRLTIASALWRLCKDPLFIECLNRAKGTSLMVPYMNHVLWLDDERAVDFLIDLLPTDDDDYYRRRRPKSVLSRLLGFSRDPDEATITGRWALSLLNRLEAGHSVRPQDGYPPSHFRERRNDRGFRELIVEQCTRCLLSCPSICERAFSPRLGYYHERFVVVFAGGYFLPVRKGTAILCE